MAWMRRVPLAIRFNVTALAMLLLSACARVPAIDPTNAFRQVTPPSLSDDGDFKELVQAIDSQLPILRRDTDTLMRFGSTNLSRGDYADALERLKEVLNSQATSEHKLNYIRDNFHFFEYYGGDRWGEVLLTSYFEPVISGSSAPTSRFSRPLYAKPNDLLTVPIAKFSEKYQGDKALKAKLDGTTVLPYYSRADIDGKGALKGKGLELVWLDPIDAFFMHIQGGGTIRLPSGEQRHFIYADKNGHRYEAIGKFLKKQIAPNPVTMQSIERLLRNLSAKERDEILYRNPSYVFYAPSDKRAITSLGVPATPGRTIAADPKFAPKGALVFLEFKKPIFRADYRDGDEPKLFEKSARFVLDQDSGGAITGTNRIDLFWGRGDEAKRHAGVIQHPARIWYLAPRDPTTPHPPQLGDHQRER